MRGMDAAELRRWWLGQPRASEDLRFGPEHSVFKVGGKMIALSAPDRTPLEVSVKLEPELVIQLRASYGAMRPGDHLNSTAGTRTRSRSTPACRTSSFANRSRTRTSSSSTPSRSARASSSRRTRQANHDRTADARPRTCLKGSDSCSPARPGAIGRRRAAAPSSSPTGRTRPRCCASSTGTGGATGNGGRTRSRQSFRRRSGPSTCTPPRLTSRGPRWELRLAQVFPADERRRPWPRLSAASP